jgi:hypothetical protein
VDAVRTWAAARADLLPVAPKAFLRPRYSARAVWSSWWTGMTAGSPGVNPQVGQDGHQHLAEGPEAFRAIPYVVNHEVPILSEAGVVEAMGVWFATDLFQPLIDLVETARASCFWDGSTRR